MAKGKAVQGVRTKDSGVKGKPVPIADATAGDEGIDEVSRKNTAQEDMPIPDDQSSTPPGAAFKDKHDLP